VNSNFFDDLLLASEFALKAELPAIAPAAALAGTVAAGIGQGFSGQSWFDALTSNLAALFVGVSLFIVGVLMLAFSSFEELADAAQKAVKLLPIPPEV
jgi:hypothetical protein